MKIVILGNQARALCNFWAVLIRRLLCLGYEVVCFVPHPAPGDDPVWEHTLTSMGTRLVHYPLDRKGFNVRRDLATLFALRSLLKTEQPNLLFASTIKPVIYGSFAAALARCPVKPQRYLMITGLGFMFEGDTLVKKLLMQLGRILYRLAFSLAGGVFFQNRDDKALFEALSILPKVPVYLCKGTGVDIAHFAPAPPAPAPLNFLYVGRLLEAKGLHELCEAAALLRARYPEARVRLLGPQETGVGAFPIEVVRHWEQKGAVEYLGSTNDVRPYIAEASVVVLPSWREGVPCSLMEGMSMGRAVIAADAPGSREVVRNGVNGLLVPVKDPIGLAKAMETFAADPGLAVRMGQAGRELMETEFSAERVAEAILTAMGVPGVQSQSTTIARNGDTL